MEELGSFLREARERERQHRRFSLQCPVFITLSQADLPITLEAVSRNISLGGLLLETRTQVPHHARVSFVMTVEGNNVRRPIRLTGEGTVVRVQVMGPGTGFAVAVECTSPITHLEECLSA